MATALWDCTTVSGASVPACYLLLIVRKRLVGQVQGALLHRHVLVSIDQVPVDVLNLRDGLDDLVAKGHVFNFAVVSGNADLAQVGIKAEALQQVLPQLEAEAGRQVRIQGVVMRIRSQRVLLKATVIKVPVENPWL